MKRCCRCKVEKELNEFHNCNSTKDGRQYVCKICQKEYEQRNRERRKEYQKQYHNQYYHRTPEKHKARNILNSAVKSGKIHKPVYCSSCDSDRHLEAHHTDYSKPLEVMWLCRSCHVDLHNKIREEEITQTDD